MGVDFECSPGTYQITLMNITADNSDDMFDRFLSTSDDTGENINDRYFR